MAVKKAECVWEQRKGACDRGEASEGERGWPGWGSRQEPYHEVFQAKVKIECESVLLKMKEGGQQSRLLLTKVVRGQPGLTLSMKMRFT